MVQDRLRMAQDVPKKAPKRAPKIGQKGHSRVIDKLLVFTRPPCDGLCVMTTLRSLKRALKCFNMVNDESKMASGVPQKVPKMASGGAVRIVKYEVKCTSPQHGFKMPYDGRRRPKMAQDGPR